MIGKDDIFGILIESRELKKLQIPRKKGYPKTNQHKI